jgi:hypothetical protein
MAKEPNQEMEADTTVKTSKEILDPEAQDSDKEMDTMDSSCLEMSPTICNDSWG